MTDQSSSKQQAIGSNIVQVNEGGSAKLTINYESPPEIAHAVAPAPPWHFTGRKELIEKIVAEINALDTPRLIALQGMGGIGKTALAKQIAKQVKNDFPGGIFWGNELSLKDGNPSIILKNWGRLCGQNLEKESEENLPSVIRSLLLARQTNIGPLLAIIDDVRLDWSGGGINIIKEALPPGTPVIITTRQIQTAQEINAKIFLVNALSRAESTHLFQSLTENKFIPEQVNKIAELCEDMPLAIELIANLTKNRKIDWLVKRLQSEANRLNTLKLDETEKKEQSVKASLEISYQALTEKHPETARTFRYLGVFAQPTFIIGNHFIRVMAQTKATLSEQILSASESMKLVEDEILRLSDWSLLTEDESIANSNVQYFRMHTLLREYAAAILSDSREIDAATDNHINYCIAFAEANPHIDIQKQDASTLEFEMSYVQLLQALMHIKEIFSLTGTNWDDEPETARQVVTLINLLDYHWQFHNKFEEQVNWLQLAYECASSLMQPIRQADFSRRLGRALTWLGKLDEALEWMKKSEHSLGDHVDEDANAVRAMMHVHRAAINYLTDELDPAEKDCVIGIGIAKKAKLPKIYAEGCNMLGAIRLKKGNLNSALEAFEESLSVWKQVGDQYQIYRVEDNVRTTFYYLGNIAQLRKSEDESLLYWKQFQNRIELAMSLTNRGLIHYIDKEYEAAIDAQKQAIEISDLLMVQRMRALTRLNIAWPYIATNSLGLAENFIMESIDIQKQYDIEEFTIDSIRCLAEIEIRRGQYGKALELASEALALSMADDDPLETGAALRVLGEAQYLSGDTEQAAKNLEASFSQLRDNDYKHECYLTLQELIKLYEVTGDHEKAQALTDEARLLAQEMGLHPNA